MIRFGKRLKLLFDAQGFFRGQQLDAVIREASTKPLSDPTMKLSPFSPPGTLSPAVTASKVASKSKGAAMEKNNANLLELIFFDYKTKAYGYMSLKGVMLSDRDDVFSEAMLKAVREAGKFDSAKATASTWFHIIIRSTIADYFRKRKKDHLLIESQLLNFYLDERIDIGFEAELGELVGQLAHLPERSKRVIAMRFYDDMKYDEIATALTLSVANVKKIYQRALRKLRGLTGYEVD